MCHGDISLNNIVINRVWSDDQDSNVEAEPDVDDTDIASISGNFSNPQNRSTSGVTSSPTDPATIVSPTEVTPVPISAYGLVIDNDNSFSLVEASEDGYKINSVRYFPPPLASCILIIL